MKRKMAVAITVQCIAELDMDEATQRSRIGLENARYTVLGDILGNGEESPALTETFRTAVGIETTKLAAQWLLDKLEGKLEEPVPVITQTPGGAQA